MNVSSANNIIEIQAFHPNENSHNDMSTSQINLFQVKKNEDNDTKKTELKIKNEFRGLCAIINLDKVMIFVYICLAFDFSKNLYQTYLLTYNLMNIIDIENSIIYIVRYSTTLFNTIGLINVIIVYKDYNEQKKRKRTDQSKKNIVKQEDTEKTLDGEFELIVPQPLKNIKTIRTTRLIVWFVNTLLFVIVVVINETLNAYEYVDIILNIVESILYHLMRFYYSVLIRIEAYKFVYDLKEN